MNGLPPIVWHPSPNFNARDAAIPLAYVVLHYTGMPTAQEALARLCDPTAQVSAHYVIDEDGTILHLVSDEKRAWHAGKSFWKSITDVNSASIGIELVNPGHAFGYRPFPEAQIDALSALLAVLYTRYALKPESLLAHSDVAPLRKEDPGELFPWARLATLGFGRWPQWTEPKGEACLDAQALSPEAFAEKLCRLGYQALPVGSDAFYAARIAFCRRYAPDDLENSGSSVVMARLNDLLRESLL